MTRPPHFLIKITVHGIYLPFAHEDISIGLYVNKAMYFLVGQHEVWFTCIVAKWIWNPHVVDVTSPYCESAVKFSSQARVSPQLTEIRVNFIFLVKNMESISRRHENILSNQFTKLYEVYWRWVAAIWSGPKSEEHLFSYSNIHKSLKKKF